MELDPLILSRAQFAFTIAFHILFPAFTIGLASYLAMLEFLWLLTGRDRFLRIYRFWLKIFAVSFGMGVVSGVVLSYQLGTNWSSFSDRSANVLGPLFAYEVLTAFFLEASFLGIMLFGMHRVGRGLHFFATLMVAIGTLISAFWILSANSWMHTPAGFEIRDGVIHASDWLAVIFNPSFPYRFVHMVLAAYLTTAFVVLGVSAWYLWRGRVRLEAAVMLKMAVAFAAIVAPLQLLAGDLHGLNTQEHQPQKVAAMEAHWESQYGAPLILFAWPDQKAERNRLEVAIPRLGSLILKHDLDARVTGLKAFPVDERPPVPYVFFAFRIMVGTGLLMILTAGLGAVLWWRGRLLTNKWFGFLAMAMTPAGFIAVLAGWTVTEVGRQPYVIYGLMRTAEGVSPVTGGAVGGSLLAFLLAYAVIFGAGSAYILRLMGKGPETADDTRHAVDSADGAAPGRLLSAVQDSLGGAE